MTLKEYLHLRQLYQNSWKSLWDAHCRQMGKFGFDRLIYGYTVYQNGDVAWVTPKTLLS